jgi:hypothetical protein
MVARCPSAFLTPPLVVPELAYNSLPKLKLCLDQPLFAKVDMAQLLSLCTIADAAVERVQKSMETAEETCVTSVLSQIEVLCKQISPQDPSKVLEKMGLFEAFPYLEQGVVVNGKLGAVSQHPGSSYLNYISLLNQVVMMGTQLYHDACVPQHHKYCAHQVALLYQCLNMLQGETKPIRKLVEARFDEIKTITESKNPVLDMEISDWLQEVTWLCREEVKNFPAYMHKKVHPITDILHSKLKC